jgi:3-hydroxybutyrate dehydrogenase
VVKAPGVEPEEVAELVACLCSAQVSYVNGASIPIDGGWTAEGRTRALR